jgi:hypothetical protein
MSAIKAPKFRTFLIWFVILLLAGLGILLLIGSINRSIQSLVNPLELTNRELSTQVFNLLHPTPTVIPDPVTIINEVRAVARLETIHYTVEKVVTVEVGQGALGKLFGDRVLFVAHGYVIAGIDMGKMNPEDMWLEAGKLNVRLPQPEVLVYSLDNDKSYVYDRSTGLLTHGNPDLETIARQAAETEILNAALADGILEQALVNAQVYLVRFFQALGYEQVIFVPPVP